MPPPLKTAASWKSTRQPPRTSKLASKWLATAVDPVNLTTITELKKNVVINTVALMVPKAQEPLKDLAKRNRGQFTIVKEGGKVEVVPLN
jgi:hypothetical protein